MICGCVIILLVITGLLLNYCQVSKLFIFMMLLSKNGYFNSSRLIKVVIIDYI